MREIVRGASMKPETLLLSTVLLVALAGLINAQHTGGVVYISGEANNAFASRVDTGLIADYQCYEKSTGELVCCYPEGETFRCIDGGATFGASSKFREGNEKMVATSPTKPGVTLG